MEYEYIDEMLVVDELILDPGLPVHMIVRIGTEFYMMHNSKTNGKVTEKDLRPYKKKVHKDWYRPHPSYPYKIHHLIPRGGYIVDIGRAATEDEFAAIVEEYKLGEDDISNEFDDTLGGFYGPKYTKTVRARQIKLANSETALALERKLRDKGIKVSSTSPSRLNIRVTPGKS